MKIISSVKRFPGTVVMPDFLTLPQVLDFEQSNDEIRELRVKEGDSVSATRVNAISLPFILSVVSEWHIEGIPEHPTIENFPMSPRLATAQLIAQIIHEITALYIGETEIPND